MAVRPARSLPPPGIDELLDGFSDISGHRLLLARLNSLLSNDTSSVQDLVAVLRLDAGLSARVILAANTIYHNLGARVASVDEAVFRVGQWEVKRLLLRSISFELTGGPLPSYGMARGELWNHSLASAIAMESLAQEIRANTDTAYTVGLMSPVGMVVVDRWLERTRRRVDRVFQPPGSPMNAELEREQVGFTSAYLGSQLLARWNFPEATIETIAHQDTPFEGGSYRQHACLLAIARWQAVRTLADLSGKPSPTAPGPALCRSAGVKSSVVFGLLDTVRARFLENKTFVGVL